MYNNSDSEIYITEESVYGFDKNINSASSFIRGVFCFLRKHMYLIEEPDYNRLYEETLDFLIREAVANHSFDEKETEQNRRCMEFVADMYNGNPKGIAKEYLGELVDRYLDYRRTFWSRSIKN